jgi:Rrf2 family protein
MRLSRSTTYAIQAVVYLAQTSPEDVIPCSQMARDGQMPERFLLHVLRTLVKHGVLRSARGVDGGYALARPPDQITLRDLVEPFENPLAPHLPTMEGQSQPVYERIMGTLRVISSIARRELQKVSVAELLNRGGDDERRRRFDRRECRR